MSIKSSVAEDLPRIESDLERTRSLLKTINDFAPKLLAMPTESELVWYVARQVVGAWGFLDCVIYLVDSDRGVLGQVAAIGAKNPGQDEIVNVLEIPIGKGITGTVAQTKIPLVIDDIRRDGRYIPDVEEMRSEICVPMVIDDEVVGVIDCEDPRPGRFDHEHLEILTTVAAMTSAKLKLIRQTQRIEERSDELRRLNTQFKEEIAERERIEEDLRSRETQLRQAQAIAKIGVFIWDDVEDRPEYYSEELIQLLGRPQGELEAVRSSHQQILQQIHPDDRAHYDTVIRKADRDHSSYVVDYRTADGEGRVRYWRESGEPETDENGRLIRTFGILQDITDIKSREEELKKSEQRYRELFEESPVPVLEEDWSPVKAMLDDLAGQGITDLLDYLRRNPDFLGRLYDAPDRYGLNQAAVELYRAGSKEEFRAALSQEGADPDELEGFGKTVAAFFAGHTSFDYEADEIACDGSPMRTHIRFAMAPRHLDDWSRVLVSIEDITYRKQAEDRLQQAQKMEAVGQLTGGVAHDFNNLLAVIQGNGELLAAGAEDDEGCLTRPLLRAVQRGAELTQRLLAFSRRQPLNPQEIDLGDLVDGMIELLSRTLGETIRIGTVAQPGLWTALADQGQVENAILNLAINARDAMPGGGKLTIECDNARLDEAYVGQNPEALVGDYVVLAVSDSGTGMTAEIREHAFEPFFTTKEVGKGSGLGLSMVYGFAKQSGGHVIIYSEEGAGTTIRLYLPRAAQPSAAKEVPAALERMPRGHGETVLVLEDDPDVRQLAVRLVASLGYQVIDVPEAASARAVLDRGEQVDLLLSDVVLPGGTSGPEFAEEARERFPDLKVIFMSGYAAEAAKRNGFLDSDKVLLDKPFQRSQLAQALHEALD